MYRVCAKAHENYNGADEICISVCDQAGACDSTTIAITVTPVNDAPVATDDFVTMTTTTDVIIDVQGNDLDVDGDDLTTTLISSTAIGTGLVFSGDEILYLAPPNFEGVDTLIYQVCDSGLPILCDTAMVIVNIDLDICAILAEDPLNAIGGEDFDGGGIDNLTECLNGSDPKDNTDDAARKEGIVWIDANNNGLFESNEQGVEDVTVYLIDASGELRKDELVQKQLTGDTLAVVLTDEEGRYVFNNISAGQYQIIFDMETSKFAQEYEYKLADLNLPGIASTVDIEGYSQIFTFDASDPSLNNQNAGILLSPKLSSVMYIDNYKTNEDNFIEVTYMIGVKNIGLIPVSNLSIQDDLAMVGEGYIGLVTSPQLVSTTFTSWTPILNSSFDGLTDLALFEAHQGEKFEVDDEMMISLTILIEPMLSEFPLMNQADVTARGIDELGNRILLVNGSPNLATDRSDSGRNYYGNNENESDDNGTPEDETLLNCIDANVEITTSALRICQGEGVRVEAASAISNVSFEWSILDTEDLISVLDDDTFFPSSDVAYELELVLSETICAYNLSDTISIEVNDEIQITASNNGELCADTNQEIILTSTVNGGQGPYEVLWQGPAGFVSTELNPVLSNDSGVLNGVYNLVITDANGCTSIQASTEVNASAQPEIPSIYLDNASVCAGSSFSASTDASQYADAIYTWNLADGTIMETSVPFISIDEASPELLDGELSLSISANGCNSPNSDIASINVIDLPEIGTLTTSNSENDPSCEGESITVNIDAISGAEYLWTGPNNFTSTSQNIEIENVTVEESGLYTLVVIVDGCESEMASANLYIESTPEAPEVFSTDSACEDSDVALRVLNPNPELLYRWFRLADNAEVGEGAVLMLSNVTMADEGEYYVIGNSANCVSEPSNTTNLEVAQPSTTIANVGDDLVVCESFYQLEGNTVSNGEGIWTNINTDAVIQDENNPTTEISELAYGENLFTWSVVSGVCGITSTDTLSILYNAVPIAKDDEYNLSINEILDNTVLTNDLPNAEDYIMSNVSDPENGTLTFNSDGTFNYIPDENYVGDDFFTYELCQPFCLESCVEARVSISIGRDSDCFAASVMTPNEDGYNDTFIIPCLANYSLSKVCIFNRWGDQVYQSDNYQNDWRGTNQSNDEALPSGTYFYVLEVNDGENTVLTGYIFIER